MSDHSSLPPKPDYVVANLWLATRGDSTIQVTLECSQLGLISEGVADLSGLDRFDEFYDHIQIWLSDIDLDEPSMDEMRQEQLRQTQLGQQLIEGGLPHEIRIGLKQIIDSAQPRRVMLVVGINAPHLEVIPWELMGGSSSKVVFGASTRLSVCRGAARYQLKRIEPDNSSSAGTPIVLVSSAPLDKYSPNPTQEFDAIQRRLSRADINITEYRFNDIRYLDFVEQIERLKPSVVHVAMHGTLTTLDFMDGNTHRNIPHETLVVDLCRVNSIRAIILNVCYSAKPKPDANLHSLARQLLDGGIPAVVGMATVITPRASLEFSDRLYVELALQKTIVDAFERAVDYLRTSRNFESTLWSIPMLYHTTNIIPFPRILAHQDTLDARALLPRDFLDETVSLFEEFERAFQELDPSRERLADDWQIEATSVRFVIPDLRDALEELEHFASSRNAETMRWAFRFQDLREDAYRLLHDFEPCLANLCRTARFRGQKGSRAEEFTSLGRQLVGKLREMTALLQSHT